jgi:hypothetical protein
MRLHHCLLLLLQHMHAPVAQLQGESTLEPVLTAYKDAVLEARAPLELAMHRSWTKDAELRRAAASLSESMSRLAGMLSSRLFHPSHWIVLQQCWPFQVCLCFGLWGRAGKPCWLDTRAPLELNMQVGGLAMPSVQAYAGHLSQEL